MEAEKVKNMLVSFCSVEDVCKAHNVSKQEFDTFCRSEFAMGADEAAEMFAAQGRAMVHAAQIEAALDGNNSMLILLGKQYLGQSDEPDVKKERKGLPISGIFSTKELVLSFHFLYPLDIRTLER